MISTTGLLSFDSGYTTKVCTDRPSCVTVTHSWCREDFASFSFAQSCAETACAIPRIIKLNKMRFIFPPCPSSESVCIISALAVALQSHLLQRRWSADAGPNCDGGKYWASALSSRRKAPYLADC